MSFDNLKTVDSITYNIFKESVTNIYQLWNENLNAIAEDFAHRYISDGPLRVQAVLQRVNMAILIPLNNTVNKINEQIVERFSRKQYTYFGFDSVSEDTLNLYPIKIPLLASEDSELPFLLERKQIPICLAFALIINKSQDQTLLHIGPYLPD
ncbi:7405_t:CDS:2 [Gigaspora margarita]|uniref:7405_t:CDS:1 n=1 Tax=Gigaspora margarita TaxID=4874 RepID=A0ABM8VWQ2_GIGMA|nr:7405_t:CDS:2 [Gigaspora margarita]